MVSAASFDGLADRLLLINTCSKTFAMTGWRVGYLAARAGLVRAPSLVHRTSCGFVNTIAQRAAVTAYTAPTNAPARMAAEYAARRDLMCDMVNAMPGLRCAKPEGAFYVFVRVDANLTSEALTEHCLSHGVAVRSGTEFGPRGEGFIRLTFAGEPANFEPGLRRLETAMRSLPVTDRNRAEFALGLIPIFNSAARIHAFSCRVPTLYSVQLSRKSRHRRSGSSWMPIALGKAMNGWRNSVTSENAGSLAVTLSAWISA